MSVRGAGIDQRSFVSRGVLPAVIGIAATFVVGFRLWLGMPRAFGEVLWAEDGLFAACVFNHGLACTWEPYAGYFLFAPRMSAFLVAQLPISLWPIASIGIAALVTGLLAATSFVILRHYGLSLPIAVLAALLYVLLPISGVETLAVHASLNAPLLITSGLAVALLPRERVKRVPVAVLLLATALTMPSAIAFVPFIVLAAWWQRIDRRTAVVWLIALVAGLIVQFIAALTAAVPRSTNLTVGAVGDWTRGLLDAFLATIPGLNVNTFELQPFVWLQPSSALSWLVIGGLMLLAIWALVRGDARRTVWAQLTLMSGVLALIPSLSGTFSFRYVVAPAALMVTGVLILADRWIAARAPIAPIMLTGVLLIVWWPAIPTAGLRSDPGPLWQETVDDAVAACRASGLDFAPVEFAPGGWPNWPSEGVRTEPAEPLPLLTQPELRCISLLAFRD